MPVKVLFQPPLPMRRRELQHQVCCRRYESRLNAGLRRFVPDGDGEMRFPDAGGPEKYDILSALDKREA